MGVKPCSSWKKKKKNCSLLLPVFKPNKHRKLFFWSDNLHPQDSKHITRHIMGWIMMGIPWGTEVSSCWGSSVAGNVSLEGPIAQAELLVLLTNPLGLGPTSAELKHRKQWDSQGPYLARKFSWNWAMSHGPKGYEHLKKKKRGCNDDDFPSLRSSQIIRSLIYDGFLNFVVDLRRKFSSITVRSLNYAKNSLIPELHIATALRRIINSVAELYKKNKKYTTDPLQIRRSHLSWWIIYVGSSILSSPQLLGLVVVVPRGQTWPSFSGLSTFQS